MASHKSTLPKAVQDVKRLVEKSSGKSVEPGVVERLVDFEYGEDFRIFPWESARKKLH
jgi:hypothetical protein